MGWTELGPYIGYAAGMLTVIAFLPQVVRAWRTRETRDLSMGTFALLVLSASLWMIYGVIQSDWPVIGTNAGVVLLNAALVIAKIRNG